VCEKARHNKLLNTFLYIKLPSVLVTCITDISRYMAGSFLSRTALVFVGFLLLNLEITPIVANIARFSAQ